MIELNQIIRQISSSTGIDEQIVKIICQHPFKFTIGIMKDEEDTHDILFNKLFKFKLKSRFKSNKTKNYSPNEDN